jgi:hypothetical protein
VTLPIEKRGVSKIETLADGSDYRVSVAYRGPPEQPGPLQIELRRFDNRPRVERDRRGDLSLAVDVNLRPGEKLLLGRLDRPDGSGTEVTAALRAAGPL